MSAQRQRAAAKVTAIRPQPRPSSASRESSDPSVASSVSSVELRQLYRMRADALAWLRSLDERILALGGVLVTTAEDAGGD